VIFREWEGEVFRGFPRQERTGAIIPTGGVDVAALRAERLLSLMSFNQRWNGRRLSRLEMPNKQSRARLSQQQRLNLMRGSKYP
jgi:hypothetical protein